MHRSGTSAMARLLSLAGAALPRNLMPANAFNELGYWEPVRIAEFNEDVLRRLDSSWDDTFGPRRRGDRPLPVSSFLQPACTLLAEEYDGDAELIVLKDPRINLLLELWRQALEDSGFSVHYVIMVRRPDEIARSLKLRDNASRQKSLLLWATYMVNCERLTRLSSRIFVQFDTLIEDHAGVLDDMERAFGITFPHRTWAAEAEAAATLSQGHKHHNVAGPLRLPEGLNPIGELYDYLSAAAAGVPPNDDVPDDVGKWLASLSNAAGPLLAEAERELTASRSQVAASDQALSETTARLAALQAQAAELRSALDAAQAQQAVREQEKAELLAAVDAANGRSDAATRAARDEAAALEFAVRAAQTEIAELNARLAAAQQQEQSVRAQLEAAQEEASGLSARLEASAQEQAELSAAVAAANSRADVLARGARKEAGRLESALDAARAEAAFLAGRLADAEQALAAREQERGDLLQAMREAEARSAASLDEARVELAALREGSAELRASLDRARETERASRERLAEARDESDALRMGRDAVSAEVAILRGALRRIENSLVWRVLGRFSGGGDKGAGAREP